MVNVDTIREGILARLESESLLPFIDTTRSQFLDLSNEILVEIVLRDASVEERVAKLVTEWTESSVSDGVTIDQIVRSIWQIDHLGETEVARSPSGSIVAATLVPVWLKSGSKETVVYVAVTYMAVMQMKELTGLDSDTRGLAKTYVASLLRRGGRSAWNPLLARNGQLEINADLALDLLRVLAKTA